MTSERRLLIAFDDIRAVTFECVDCEVRLTMALDKIMPPALNSCPNQECKRVWMSPTMTQGRYYASDTAEFVSLLPEVAKLQRSESDTPMGVRIFFEINEPK